VAGQVEEEVEGVEVEEEVEKEVEGVEMVEDVEVVEVEEDVEEEVVVSCINRGNTACNTQYSLRLRVSGSSPPPPAWLEAEAPPVSSPSFTESQME